PGGDPVGLKTSSSAVSAQKVVRLARKVTEDVHLAITPARSPALPALSRGKRLSRCAALVSGALIATIGKQHAEVSPWKTRRIGIRSLLQRPGRLWPRCCRAKRTIARLPPHRRHLPRPGRHRTPGENGCSWRRPWPPWRSQDTFWS